MTVFSFRSGDVNLTFNDPSLWNSVMSDYTAIVTNNLTYWDTYTGIKQAAFFVKFAEYIKQMTPVSSRIRSAFVDFYNETTVSLSINGV